jgi:hypothetical protein
MTFICTPDEFLAASFMERRKLVVAQIDADPQHYNQTRWMAQTECGTVYCLGGWAVILAGGHISCGPDGECLDTDDVLICVSAAGLLGLGMQDAARVFQWDNDRDVAVDRLIDAPVRHA